MKIKYTKRKAIVPLCGSIPKGYIRFADKSTSWTNPIGMYPLRGLILKGLFRFADLSRRELDVFRQKPIMLVTHIVNGLLERCVTIAKNIMFFKRLGINVLRQFLRFVAYFFLERT